MPTLQSAVSAAWGAAAPAQATVAAPWSIAAVVQSIGSAYAAPPVPPGSTVVAAGDLTPRTEILPAASYRSAHTPVMRNVRATATTEPLGAVIPAISGSIDLPDGSAQWRLSATIPRASYDQLRAGEQPPLASVTLAGRTWVFLVDEMNAPRAFASTDVSIRGVSLAALADAPYELARQWTSDAPTTVAQIAELAQTYTGLDVSWQLPDWGVPAGAWSYTGTPWGAVLQVAAPVRAVVEADPADLKVKVTSRYPVMPQQWATTVPDVQIPWQVVESEAVTAADKPPYTGVFVTGPAETIAAVRLAGTSGAEQAPLMAGDLLTDLPGQVEMGRTVLAQSGGAESVTRSLQVLTGAGEPGVIDRGKLVRWVDPDATWTGMVRALRVDWQFGQVRQTITCERRTSFPVGSVVPEPPEVERDPFWADVIALMPFDGDFANLAPGGISFTSTGTTTSSTAKFGQSLALNGTAPGGGGPNGLVGVGADSSNRWGLTEGDFTIELWVYLKSNVSSFTYAPLVRLASTTLGTEINFRIFNGDTLSALFTSAPGGATDLSTTTTVPLNRWVHVALCRESNVYRLFQDGALLTFFTSPYSAPAGAKTVQIGTVGAFAPDALFDDLRVTKAARYTAAFTPPTKANPTS